MFSPRFALLLGCAMGLCAIASSRADTVTLKGGEKIEGKVVKETDKDLTIEYKASASITDTRVVLKAEVEKVEKESPEKREYQAIKSIKPGANSPPAASYDGAIGRLQSFVNLYPQSAHASEVGQQLT